MDKTIRDRVLDFYETVWNQGFVERCPEYCADDVHDVHHGQRGAEAMSAVVSSLRATFPDLTFTVDDVLAEGTRVVTRWTMRGTDEGGLFSLPPTHRRVEFSGFFMDQLESGQITTHWGTSDMLGLLQQLGVVPVDWAGDRFLE